MRMLCQMPIDVTGPDSERNQPEPDVAVLAEDSLEYEKRHPRGDELLLAVEVSDTTVDFDLSRKAILYSNACVPEYWVMDLTRRQIVVHRQPAGSTYRLRQIFFESDTISMEGRTETIRVSALLPANK